MKKRLLSLAVALTMCLSLLPAAASAEPEPARVNLARDVSIYGVSTPAPSTNETPWAAMDGNRSQTKWCAPGGGSAYFVFKLPKATRLTNMAVVHAAAGKGETARYNTVDYQLEILNSDKITEETFLDATQDDQNSIMADQDYWTPVAVVTNNRQEARGTAVHMDVERAVFRFNVLDAGTDGTTRIYELELYDQLKKPDSFWVNGVILREQESKAAELYPSPIDCMTDVKWSIEDESIATVDQYGVVTGLKVGQTNLTATSKDYPELTASTFVSVKPMDVSSANVTFRIYGGTWADGTTEDKVLPIKLINGSAYLSADQFPKGMIPFEDCSKDGFWQYPSTTSSEVGEKFDPASGPFKITEDVRYEYMCFPDPVYKASSQVLIGGGRATIKTNMFGYMGGWSLPDGAHEVSHHDDGYFYYSEYEFPSQTKNYSTTRDFYSALYNGKRTEKTLRITVLSPEDVHPFTDVKETDWFYAPAMWAYVGDVASGVGNNQFGPGMKCSRAQIVTFLWSAAGKPAPKTTENPFTDVKETDWFYNAVLWAVENGITTGMTDTTFGPTVTCNRAQAVTFLWKSAGEPEASAILEFTDVPDYSWYEKPVQWAVENGITAGMGNNTFGSVTDCLRAQIVTFMHRAP